MAKYFYHTDRARKKGFTLIELLVVIAIIAILAAILFPVFARARENARRAGCMSNLKQIGLAIMQYTQDYDEMYPGLMYYPTATPQAGWPGKYYRVSDGSHSGNVVSWMDMIYPYVRSVQIFTCPSQPDSTKATSGSSTWDVASYGYCGSINGFDNNHYGLTVHTISGTTVGMGNSAALIQRPADIVMIFDYQYLYSNYNTAYYFSDYLPYQGTATANIISPHLDGTNILYADGHAKWSLLSQVVGPYTVNAGTGTANSVYNNPHFNPSF